MNPRQVASLAIAITGLVGIVYSFKLLQGITSSVIWMESGDPVISLFVMAAVLVPYFLLVGFSVVLVARRDRVAQLWFPKAPTTPSPITANQLRAVGYSVAGVLLIGLAVPDVTQVLGSLFFIVFPSQAARSLFESQSLEFVRYARSSWSFALGTVVQAGIGVYLVRLGRRTDPLPDATEEAYADNAPSRTCPHCDHPYRLSEYDSSLEIILCSKCKGAIPRTNA